MADNINNINSCDDDDHKHIPLPIDITRLKEMKAMEEAEQRLIEDIFFTQIKVKAQTNASQKKPHLLNKKAITINNPK